MSGNIWDKVTPDMTIEEIEKLFADAGVVPVKPGEIDPKQAYEEMINRRTQNKINDAWSNVNKDMSIDDFMDQFVGVDGITQQDIDGQKIINRAKQNKNSGLSEQESIEDIWKYVNDNQLQASVEDVQKAFESAGVVPVAPGEVNAQEADKDMLENRSQQQINDAYSNIDENTTIEEFMDRFVGVDGQTQADIDGQKVINRAKQNVNSGMSEQEAIDDVWKYINDNQLQASIEDVQKAFEGAGVVPVEAGEINPKQAYKELIERRDQDKIEKIWQNMDPNMSVEDFMDQFAGIDGVSQQDIDKQKIINRAKQNKQAGMSEQESISDMWQYITENNINASVEDVESVFTDTMNIEPVGGPKQKPKPSTSNVETNGNLFEFEDETINLVNTNRDIQKGMKERPINLDYEKDKKKPSTLKEQLVATFNEIKDTLKERKAARNKVINRKKYGKYEYTTVNTSNGRIGLVRNRRTGEAVQRSFRNKENTFYGMFLNNDGMITEEIYGTADMYGYGSRKYKQKTKRRGKRIKGDKTPEYIVNESKAAWNEAAEIMKNSMTDDQWKEYEQAFNFDPEGERQKFRDDTSREAWDIELSKDEQTFLDEREKRFLDEKDRTAKEYDEFKEDMKGRKQEIRDQLLENEKAAFKTDNEFEKVRLKNENDALKEELQEIFDEQKTLRKNRTSAKQAYNDRNTVGMVDKELGEHYKNFNNIEDITQQLDELNNIDLKGLSNEELEKITKNKAKLKTKIDKYNNEEAALTKLKKKVTKSSKTIEELSEKEFVKKVGMPAVFSGINAIGTYKDNRREGKSVASSVVRAAGDFVLSETLGMGAYMAVSLVKEVPTMAVQGSAALFKEMRRMNSSSRFSTFGDAQFQDTQQLATMRQSGMELAKMSQYRLEQTLMGNEAKYLHK